MSTLTEVGEEVQSVAKKAGPAVVGIGQRWGVGSGVVVASGQILTNAHNVRGDEVTVTWGDGRSETAKVAGVDREGDIAVLALATGDVSPIEWGEQASKVELGFPVFGLANPGGRGLRVTYGLVSGTERSFRGPRGRTIAGSIEHTAPLLPGSSGGPIVDSSGRLLGINTNRLGEGFYLAIPADDSLRQRVQALSRGEAPARPRLGIGIAPSYVAKRLRRAVGLPEVEGLLVRFVEEEGPANAAGIREGDLIVEANGKATAKIDELHELVEGLEAGSSLDLKILRGTEERMVKVSPKK
jgi:serine protease Do